SAWYGDPLPVTAAEAMLERAGVVEQARLRAGMNCFQPQLLALVCRAWLDDSPQRVFERHAVAATTRHERALLALIQGQLLASCKLDPAMGCLQSAFRLAAPLLEASEYLDVLRRHEVLAYLPWSDRPQPPQGLAALLREAAVVKRLRADERRHHEFERDDTVG
ncbi:MAG: hypothetical protein R3308_02185, partial [Thiohalobacterales bacterium]|nr:hypothetical protein [Thiohalobacterales bacterium]